MSFEFDPQKSQKNKVKHGISFAEAQALWMNSDRMEIPLQTFDELRVLVVGKILSRHWSAIITYRDVNTQIISVRRSRKEEIEVYEGESARN